MYNIRINWLWFFELIDQWIYSQLDSELHEKNTITKDIEKKSSMNYLLQGTKNIRNEIVYLLLFKLSVRGINTDT